MTSADVNDLPLMSYICIFIQLKCKLSSIIPPSNVSSDCVPADLKDPFYTDQYEQEHLKPPVTSLLLSADLYCRAGSLILKSDSAKPLLGHDAVIQALAQRGLYVTDQERLVTERDLRKRPLQMVREIVFFYFFKSFILIVEVNFELWTPNPGCLPLTGEMLLLCL